MVKKEGRHERVAAFLKTLVTHNVISSHCRDAGSKMLMLDSARNGVNETEQNIVTY